MRTSRTDNYNVEAIESLRQINRELLVTSMSDVAEEAANECDCARDHVTKAIRLLVAINGEVTHSAEELPAAIFKSLVGQSARKFACLLPPGVFTESEEK
jgi:ADP-ribosylglycohydrolase